MKTILDTARATLTCEEAGQVREMPLYSTPAFEIISREWVRVGWNQKYPYTFSWFGRPVIQLPDDLIRIQEVLYRVQPDVIIETGVAHGGSLVFYASICKAMSKGRIVGIDIEIRPHNRAAIERHEFSGLITLLEGGSADDAIVKQAHDLVKPGERVLVILDSCHTKEHVMAELEAYSDLVCKVRILWRPTALWLMFMMSREAKPSGAPTTRQRQRSNSPPGIPSSSWNNRPGHSMRVTSLQMLRTGRMPG